MEGILDRLKRHADKEYGRPALGRASGGSVEWISYGGLVEMLGRTASGLAEACGEDASIAVLLDNRAESAVFALASMWSGAHTVIIDPLSFSEDLEAQLSDASPCLVYASPSIRDMHRAELEGYRVISDPEEVSGEWIPPAGGFTVAYYYAGIAGRTMQVIHGSTGISASAWSFSEHMGIRGDSTSIVVAPLSHALGLQLSLLSPLYVGGSALIAGRFREDTVARLLEDLDGSFMLGVPLMYKRLLGSIRRPRCSWVASGGAYLPPELQREWEEKTGVELLQFYGMTEAAPVSATRPGANRYGSIGLPVPGLEARIVDPETGAEADRGELYIKGPMVMMGYRDPAETARVFTPEGWLKTGDIVERDPDGYLYFRGVLKRMIKYKGYPVFPRDLEAILLRHPAVAEARVVGEPHEEYGQIPVAYVKLRPGHSVSGEELMDYVNRRVSAYKKIRKIYFVGHAQHL